MLQVKLEAIRKVVCEDIPKPEAKESEAVVQVAAVGICGSDMHVYVGKNPVLQPPRVQGHEFGGIIKSINGDAGNLKVGMKVAVNPVINCKKCYYCTNGMEFMCEDGQVVIGGQIPGGMAEEIAVPLRNLVPLDEAFPLLHTAMIEPTAVAMHTADDLRNATVLIIGLGPIGLLCQQVCQLNGNSVIGVDISAHSLACSKQMGATFTVNSGESDFKDQIRQFLGDKKIDVVIDSVCNETTLKLAVDIVRKCGKIKMVGIPHKNFEVDVLGILLNEIELASSYLYSDEEFLRAARYISANKIDVEPMISKVFPLVQAQEAYEYKLNEPSLKVVLTNEN
ncbi:zinc-binding dehydrogenase [Paenibacillus sp. J2TS4]|uniref:zinc-dependent alcohol dehydrogenase n=1 Tax=Paenibacillus sp. J2TS4 TaxID=2807194 RepID=UPI001B24FAC8|nr:alcohol dehydrogenase catalytic domain-containing protein [Paenibacillus sp. J2TS4]GIP30952.1 putative zinc-type alcohol dehydrogenase-like protein YjmD [Paenibacillus sp. J2TS4]